MAGFLGSLWQDLRFGFRSLNKDRRFAALAVLALALGIGAVTVIFSAIYGVILNTFPFPHAGQVTSFAITDLAHPQNAREGLLFEEFLYFREHNHVFQDLSGEFGGFGSTPLRWTTGNATYQFDADYLTANSFKFFGLKPVLGRMPSEDDVKAGAPPVFVIGERLWRRQFNSDPSIVGKSFMLNGLSRVLVGIMPPRWRWAWVDAWVPIPLDPNAIIDGVPLGDRVLYTVGRLKPGVTLREAASDLNVVAHEYARIQPKFYPKQFTVTTATLAERVTAGFKQLIYPAFAAVLLLLLIACANVANLLLARATARDREIAMRATLGASRWRLIRQLLVESLLLAALGCAAGCGVAWFGIAELVPLVPYNAFPQEAVIRLNLPVLLVAMGIATLTVLLCGLFPALHAVRGDLHPRLAGSGKGAAGQSRHGLLRSALVVAEVALSIVLLSGAGLMMRTFLNVQHADFGFDTRNLLTAGIGFPAGFQHSGAGQNLTLQKILDNLRALPGVTGATLSVAPPPMDRAIVSFDIPGRTHSDQWNTRLDLCNEDYFGVLELRLLRGRLLSRSDVDAGRRVVVINQAFARRFFRASSPIGQDVLSPDLPPPSQASNAPASASAQSASAQPPSPLEIIGVVSDIKNNGASNPPQPQIYAPFTAVSSGGGVLMLRTAVDPDSLIPAVRQRVWAIDRDLALINPQSVHDQLEQYAYANPQFEFAMLAVFAAIGLLLISIGVFSVMAYTVSLRTNEIGIRMALGAQRADVLRIVLRRGLALIAVGIVMGLFATWGATREIAHQLQGVSPTDPLTLAGAAAIVILAGLAACLGPARRATKLDPLASLRHE